jgi:hypothetical protein
MVCFRVLRLDIRIFLTAALIGPPSSLLFRPLLERLGFGGLGEEGARAKSDQHESKQRLA